LEQDHPALDEQKHIQHLVLEQDHPALDGAEAYPAYSACHQQEAAQERQAGRQAGEIRRRQYHHSSIKAASSSNSKQQKQSSIIQAASIKQQQQAATERQFSPSPTKNARSICVRHLVLSTVQQPCGQRGACRSLIFFLFL
jgi:ATPase subunit of ABC transporter with duplicated ATPase domains